MILRTLLLTGCLITSLSLSSQNSFTGTGGGSTAAIAQFETKMNLGYKAGAQRAEELRVDGTPYLFENWGPAIITTSDGSKLKIENVNFDGRRNKIVHRLSQDSIYTFNSLVIDRAIINGKTFMNVTAPDNSIIKVYEVIAETDDFKILKDYVIDINEGSSNPMRGTIYSRYITREYYMLLTDDGFNKFKLRKKKLLNLLGDKEDEVEEYVDEKDLNYKNEEDVNKIVNYFSAL